MCQNIVNFVIFWMFFFEILLLSFLSVCPSVRLSVNKKVHTCIVRETWKILWKYQKFFEKNQLGPSVCLLVIKKVHTCFEKTVQNREKCLYFFFQTRYFSSSYSKQPQGVPQSIQRSIIRLLELLLDSKMYPSES